VTASPLDRLRAVCLALPEAEERETWGDATFRVRGRIFAMVRRGDGRVSFWCKAPPGSQAILVEADPARFFAPPYVGHKGWVGMRIDDGGADWAEVALLVRRSYGLTAPKGLAARLTDAPTPASRPRPR
jgi:predicted DNA-binding protein (MmcQ/YjbR family)